MLNAKWSSGEAIRLRRGIIHVAVSPDHLNRLPKTPFAAPSTTPTWAIEFQKSAHSGARLFLTRVQLVEGALQLFQFLSCLAEFAFGGQALVVGKVFGSFGD